MYSHDIHDSSSKPHGLEVGCDTTAAAMTDKKTTRVVQLDCADVSNDDDDFEDIFQVTEEWRQQKTRGNGGEWNGGECGDRPA